MIILIKFYIGQSYLVVVFLLMECFCVYSPVLSNSVSYIVVLILMGLLFTIIFGCCCYAYQSETLQIMLVTNHAGVMAILFLTLYHFTQVCPFINKQSINYD